MNANIALPSRTQSSLSQRKLPSVVHLSSKKDLIALPLGLPKESPQCTLVPLGLSRSYSSRPLGRTLLVKAEFVFADSGAQNSVSLHGDWNEFAQIQLHREEADLWSCVAVVPTGHREFYFVVDGRPVLSSRHPVSVCGTRNWRNVHGPRMSEPKNNARTAFSKWAQGRLEGLGLVVAPGDVESGIMGAIGEIEQPVTARRRENPWDKAKALGWGTLVVIVFSMYLAGAAVHALVFAE